MSLCASKYKRFISLSQLSIIKVLHSGFVHSSTGSWALSSLAYLQTTHLPFLSSVVSWTSHAGICQCACLMCVGIGTSLLLSPRARSVRCATAWTFHGPLLYFHTNSSVILQDRSCPYTAVLSTQHLINCSLKALEGDPLYLQLWVITPRRLPMNWWNEKSVTSNTIIPLQTARETTGFHKTLVLEHNTGKFQSQW